ncbi:MAG: hypothetical protein ACJ780_20060, partial [Solirubrobacteraceae bacterium]
DDFEKSAILHQPLVIWRPDHMGSEAFRSLADELDRIPGMTELKVKRLDSPLARRTPPPMRPSRRSQHPCAAARAPPPRARPR